MNDEGVPVLPVGLAIGRSTASPAATYTVADAHGVELLSEDEWNVWILAGGTWSSDGRWARADLARAADEAEVTDFCRVYSGLLGRRLLVETDVSGNWARTVTVQPLLAGLGAFDREGTQFGLGVLGQAPFVRLDAQSYDAWQWLPFGPTLAAAAETLGLVSAVHGWTTVTDQVASLIAGGAAYLSATKEGQ